MFAPFCSTSCNVSCFISPMARSNSSHRLAIWACFASRAAIFSPTTASEPRSLLFDTFFSLPCSLSSLPLMAANSPAAARISAAAASSRWLWDSSSSSFMPRHMICIFWYADSCSFTSQYSWNCASMAQALSSRADTVSFRLAISSASIMPWSSWTCFLAAASRGPSVAASTTMISSALFEACLASSLIRSLPAALQALSVLANFCCAPRVGFDSISSSSSPQIEPDDCSNWNELPDEPVWLLWLLALFVMRSQIKAPARGKAKGNTIFRRRFLMLSAFLLSIEKISSFLQSHWNNLLTTICMPTQSCS